MRNRQIVLTAFFVIGSLHFLYGNEMILKGVYLGKNLYFENPVCGPDSSFSTRYVFVNNVLKLTNPTSSTYEVDLSEYPLNSDLEIKIVYTDGYMPEAINPQVIKPKSLFNFEKLDINEDSLTWVTAGEKGIHKFLIERRKDDNWLIVQTCDGKGAAVNRYSMGISLDLGENRYRVKYIDGNGKSFYSGVVSLFNNKSPVTFSTQDSSDKITLSRIAQYKVFDPDGRLLSSGKDKEIKLDSLKPGIYYLMINNRTESFVKK